MKYIYRLSGSDDVKEVGRNLPQIRHVIHPQSFPEKIPTPFPKVDYTIKYELNFGNKWTDWLGGGRGQGYKGGVINEKIKLIFEQFKICTHKLHQAIVQEEKGSTSKPYFWLTLNWEDGVHLINFNESSFKFTKLSKTVEIVTFKDSKEFLEFKQNKCVFPFFIKPESVVLIKDIQFDLFTLPFDHEIYISEQLVKELTQKKVTGITVRNPKRYLSQK